MKKFRVRYERIVSLLLCLCFLLSMGASKSTMNSKAKTNAMDYVSKMEPGWNLGNSFDAVGNETSWGNPIVSKELIYAIKEQGFNSIRIPITWIGHFDEKDENYKITESYFDRLDMVIKDALEAGLYVIINLHHDSWKWVNKMETDDTVLLKFNALWKQISEHYKDYSDKLVFESINEPTFDGVSEARMIELLNSLNQSFYDIVRSSGGINDKRMLLLPTVYTNDSQVRVKALYDMMLPLEDSNLIATVHYYGFWPFSVNIAGKTTFDKEVRKELEQAFDRVYNQFIANGIPVICGEYGLLGFDNSLETVEHGEILKYFEYINYYAKEKQILLMLWDNGQHFNRNKFTWSDEELYNIIKYNGSVRSSYTESDRIFIHKESEITDLPIKVTYNGNKLKGISLDKKELVLNTDYTLNDDTIILSKNVFEGLIDKTKEDYGVKGVLEFSFSEGANWKVYLNYYNTPVFKPVSGTSSSISIPVEFNGTKLSTMEAIYTNGSTGNAGPQNWTSYKQFGETFSPDYLNNSITINNKFFKETKNGDILLKFHFQSGEILEYTITKSDELIKEVSWTPIMEEVKVVDNNLDEILVGPKGDEDEAILEEDTIQDVVENSKETVSQSVTSKSNIYPYLIGIVGITMLVIFVLLFRKQRRK